METEELKKIMTAYDKAKDDAEFDKYHPIFQMAEHIDGLSKKLDQAIDLLGDKERAYLLALWMNESASSRER